jgi:uncharacterized membrane protein YeaQ/YmgE (transglycosylase-associated protein family)
MEQHIKILGTLHIVFGSLGILLALAMLLLFGGIAGLMGASGYSGDSNMGIPSHVLLGGIGALIFFVLLVLSLPGLIAGIGLLQFQPWARILTIVLSVLYLIHVPFGTALGVYGLWALLSQDAERLFRRA